MKKIILIVSIVVLLAAFGAMLAKFGWHSTFQIVQSIFEKAEKADIAHALVFENSQIEFSYPRNWRIDRSDPDYDPESYLDLNPPENGKFLVMIQDETYVLEAVLENLEEKYKKLLMPKQQKTPTSSYGNLEGAGIELRGAMLGTYGLIRIFATYIDTKTLILVEHRYDDDEVYNRAGYELIERTLRVKR